MIYIFLAHFVAIHKCKDVLSMNIIEEKVDFKCFYQLFHRPPYSIFNCQNLQRISFIFSVCIGTNGRMSVPNNREHHYRNLRDRYTNCTYVDGNLELTWLQDENLDLDFLKDIREVRGMILE